MFLLLKELLQPDGLPAPTHPLGRGVFNETPSRNNNNNNINYSVLMYSHLRNINNLLEIILLKYNVIEFFMIFKIIGDVYDINIQTATTFFVRKFQYDGKATPECLFEKGLCFNYCENRARYPVSTTFFCKNNRLNIYKHSNFV